MVLGALEALAIAIADYSFVESRVSNLAGLGIEVDRPEEGSESSALLVVDLTTSDIGRRSRSEAEIGLYERDETRQKRGRSERGFAREGERASELSSLTPANSLLSPQTTFEHNVRSTFMVCYSSPTPLLTSQLSTGHLQVQRRPSPAHTASRCC